MAKTCSVGLAPNAMEERYERTRRAPFSTTGAHSTARPKLKVQGSRWTLAAHDCSTCQPNLERQQPAPTLTKDGTYERPRKIFMDSAAARGKGDAKT